MKTKCFLNWLIQKLNFAVVTKSTTPLIPFRRSWEIKQIIIGSPNIDVSEVKSKIKVKDFTEVEHWLNKQKWYSHDPAYKIILAVCFNKKRPSMIPNYIVPSEYEMMGAFKKTGVSVVWNCNAKAFIYDKKLQKIWDSKQMPATEVFLLSGKMIYSYCRFSNY
jgi:hypothetical protein